MREQQTMETRQPLVSVVMPCLNAQNHVRRAVQSVLGQTLGDLELIVVDNGSTDSTPYILSSIEDRRLRVLTEPERGVSRARNTGLHAAQGHYLAFLDADDTWEPTFLEKMHAALSVQPDAAIAYCGWQNLSPDGVRCQPFIPPEYEGPDKLERLLVNNRWPIHAVLARRADVLSVGGFDSRLFIAEDYLLWLEMSLRGRLLRVPEVLAYYHHHDGTQATDDKAMVIVQLLTAKFIFLAHHPEVKEVLGAQVVDRLTWGLLLEGTLALRAQEPRQRLVDTLQAYARKLPRNMRRWLPLDIRR